MDHNHTYANNLLQTIREGKAACMNDQYNLVDIDSVQLYDRMASDFGIDKFEHNVGHNSLSNKLKKKFSISMMVGSLKISASIITWLRRRINVIQIVTDLQKNKYWLN